MPRHPPCALQHFTHNKHAQTTKPDTKKDARIHYATLNTPPHPEPTTTTTTPTHRHRNAPQGCVRRSRAGSGHQKKQPTNRQDVFSGPNSVPNRSRFLASCSTQPHPPNKQRGVEITRRKPTTTCRGLPPHTGKLLRKEVIQPHLPVRLPCYDFVPIAGPTFDHSPPTRGLGHGLRVLPTFVT